MFRGIRWTGESGEDEGEGSERGDESVVEKVVVGEDSADSEACVDVLSVCLCAAGSARSALDRKVGCCPALSKSEAFGAKSTILGSTMVTVS